MMSEKRDRQYQNNQTRRFKRNDGGDTILSAIHDLRRILEASGEPYRAPSFACVEKSLRQWARDVGALLNPDDILPQLRIGGQEHDIFEKKGRVFKVTKGGYFGFNPGLNISIEIQGTTNQRFHLWEAHPLQYLERLHLQNQFVPGLVELEGILETDQELAIVTSQVRFDLVYVNRQEIGTRFDGLGLGFSKITNDAYYRSEDNRAVFDAHDKNVIRFNDDLIPFDVIPCHPDQEMMGLIEDALAEGKTVISTRTSHTTSRTQAGEK